MVTLIANYLATTLPNQMSVNDLEHELQVENQLGHFATALESLSARAPVGATLAQPLSLGSAGDPPFANPDGASISALLSRTNASVAFGVASTQYAPITGWIGGGSFSSSCSPTPSPPASAMNISCTGSGAQVHYNFTNCPSGCTLTTNAAGKFWGNYSVNSSRITVSETGGSNGFEHVELVGSHDTMTVSGTGGDVINVTIVGNSDSVSISDSSGATVRVLVVGNQDSVTFSVSGNSNSLLLVGWGEYDSYATTGSGTGNFNVYYTGFDPTIATTPICPYGSLSSTDTVSGGTGTVTYNNTAPSNHASGWTYHSGSGESLCPYFPLFPGGGRTVVAASFVVQMRNTYAPEAEIAFDQGAVVYVQPGGYPILIDAPSITLANGIASVWLPAFVHPVASEAGTATAILSTHLVSVQRVTFPGGGWYVNPHVPVTLVLDTPYASAWFNSAFARSLTSSGATVGCAPIAPAPASVCTGPYEPGPSLGQIMISLPVSTMLTLNIAVFAVTLQ